MKLLALLKAKLVLTVLAGVVLAGGATAVVAATPTGQQLFQAISHSTAQGTKTPEATQQGQQGQANTCPGLPDAQNLAAQYTPQ